MNIINERMRNIRIEIEHLNVLLNSPETKNKDDLKKRINQLKHELDGLLTEMNRHEV